MADWIKNYKIVKDQEPAGPLVARSDKGTYYTQVNDSTYDWVNDYPGRAGSGTIHLDPNSGGPWGTYTTTGAGGPNEEKRLSRDALNSHLWNIENLNFLPEKSFSWDELKEAFKDWARERGYIK